MQVRGTHRFISPSYGSKPVLSRPTIKRGCRTVTIKVGEVEGLQTINAFEGGKDNAPRK